MEGPSPGVLHAPKPEVIERANIWSFSLTASSRVPPTRGIMGTEKSSGNSSVIKIQQLNFDAECVPLP